MAYSLSDPYRPLRVVMRVNGIVLGLLLGAMLLLASPAMLTSLGHIVGAATLTARLAGTALIAVGLFLIANASVREIGMAQLVPCLVFHLLLAFTLLLAWFRQDMAELNIAGQIGLLIVFALSLIGALTPVRFFRAEYQR